MILDYNYVPEVLKKHQDYTEVKKVLRENKLCFQTSTSASLRVFYEEEMCMYNPTQQYTDVSLGFR